MKILITGADGFIGSTLVARTAGRHQLVACARDASLLRSLVSSRNDVELAQGDITDEGFVQRSTEGMDCIVHLAGVKGSDKNQAQPSQALLSNVLGTHLLLHWARKRGMARFIFASSYWAYGFYAGQEMPLVENMELRPNETYGSCKAISEKEIIDSGQNHVILRLSNVYGYGAGLKYGGEVISSFLESARRGDPLRLHECGRQRLDFIHVADVCDCICRFVEDAHLSEGVYNVGSGIPRSIADVAGIVARTCESVFGRRVEIRNEPGPSDQTVLDRWLSIDKVKRETGWRPAFSMEEGIASLAKVLSGVK